MENSDVNEIRCPVCGATFDNWVSELTPEQRQLHQINMGLWVVWEQIGGMQVYPQYHCLNCNTYF